MFFFHREQAIERVWSQCREHCSVRITEIRSKHVLYRLGLGKYDFWRRKVSLNMLQNLNVVEQVVLVRLLYFLVEIRHLLVSFEVLQLLQEFQHLLHVVFQLALVVEDLVEAVKHAFYCVIFLFENLF